MHDAKGRELKVGDRVLVPATVTRCSPGENCTLDAKTVGVMPGNGSINCLKTQIGTEGEQANAEGSVLNPAMLRLG